MAAGAGDGQSQRPTSNTASSTGAGAGAGARESNVSDDFELLRNYGLDKFSLLDGGSTKKQAPALLHVNGSTGKGENQPSTTNASVNAQVLPNGRQMGCNGGSKIVNNGPTKASFNNWTTFD